MSSIFAAMAVSFVKTEWRAHPALTGAAIVEGAPIVLLLALFAAPH